jgi:hypothetical protein
MVGIGFSVASKGSLMVAQLPNTIITIKMLANRITENNFIDSSHYHEFAI